MRRALFACALLALLTATWSALAGSASVAYVTSGALVALGATLVWARARRYASGPLFTLSALRSVPAMVWSALRSSLEVLALVFARHPPEGRWLRIELPHAGEPAAARVRNVASTFALSFGPGSVAAEVDRDHVFVHVPAGRGEAARRLEDLV